MYSAPSTGTAVSHSVTHPPPPLCGSLLTEELDGILPPQQYFSPEDKGLASLALLMGCAWLVWAGCRVRGGVEGHKQKAFTWNGHSNCSIITLIRNQRERVCAQFPGTCSMVQTHFWIHPAGRLSSGGWWCCRSPRQPASLPSSVRSWSSGTPSMTQDPVYSSRWSTEDRKGDYIIQLCIHWIDIQYLSLFINVILSKCKCRTQCTLCTELRKKMEICFYQCTMLAAVL